MPNDPTRPLHFDLIDGEVNLMSVEYFMIMMNEIIGPINEYEKDINDALKQINNRVDVWLEEQADE